MSKLVEEWRPVVGYEGLYEVSDWGNVRNRYSKVLKAGNNGNGYCYVCLCKNGSKNNNYVHRLVAEAFIPNPDNLPEVNHIDENKSNNAYCNLEWCDRKYNLEYSSVHEKVTETKRKPVYQYTLDDKLVKKWDSMMECEKYGFLASSIGKCANNIKYYNTHKGHKWSFKPL